MCMHHYQYLARFGLMHMLATNLCIWFDNVVKETLRSLNGKIEREILNFTGREANFFIIILKHMHEERATFIG